MFSPQDGILLSGTHDEGSWSLAVDTQVRDQIVAQRKQFFDSMKGCAVWQRVYNQTRRTEDRDRLPVRR